MGNTPSTTKKSSSHKNRDDNKKTGDNDVTKSKPAASVTTETLHSKLNVTVHTEDYNRNVFDYYEKVKVIGEGSTCKIYAVRRINAKDNQQLLALKEIAKDQVDGVFLEELRNEVAILRTLDHPNIVRVYEMFESKQDS